jgi:hypothetical protein
MTRVAIDGGLPDGIFYLHPSLILNHIVKINLFLIENYIFWYLLLLGEHTFSAGYPLGSIQRDGRL